PDSEGGYTVIIPDLPGCISEGDTLTEAMQNIQEAKALWIKTAIEHQDDIPLPSAL
ncbi:MAG: type II toxin-antitoxin system HicB family antitoxin, partial [Moorea sp. SIO3C2]|nr:type II toxin-antitoxin system HicB family antitoxin [Moorena sp. SIO3C2]